MHLLAGLQATARCRSLDPLLREEVLLSAPEAGPQAHAWRVDQRSSSLEMSSRLLLWFGFLEPCRRTFRKCCEPCRPSWWLKHSCCEIGHGHSQGRNTEWCVKTVVQSLHFQFSVVTKLQVLQASRSVVKINLILTRAFLN